MIITDRHILRSQIQQSYPLHIKHFTNLLNGPSPLKLKKLILRLLIMFTQQPHFFFIKGLVLKSTPVIFMASVKKPYNMFFLCPLSQTFWSDIRNWLSIYKYMTFQPLISLTFYFLWII